MEEEGNFQAFQGVYVVDELRTVRSGEHALKLLDDDGPCSNALRQTCCSGASWGLLHYRCNCSVFMITASDLCQQPGFLISAAC